MSLTQTSSNDRDEPASSKRFVLVADFTQNLNDVVPVPPVEPMPVLPVRLIRRPVLVPSGASVVGN